MKKLLVGSPFLFLITAFVLYGCDSYEAPLTGVEDSAEEAAFSPFDVPGNVVAKEFEDYNGANAVIGDYQVTLAIPSGKLFGDTLETYVWTVEYLGNDANEKINHFAITLDECAVEGFYSEDSGFNSNSSTEFDVQWHPAEGQGPPYVFTAKYPPGQGRWIGYGPAEIKTSGNQKNTKDILLPCMNTTTLDASVFFDNNRSGVQDDGEDGQSGITVELRDADNLYDQTTDDEFSLVAIETSGADGSVLFEGVFVPGSYRFSLPDAITDLWLTTNLPDQVDIDVTTTTSSQIGLDKYDILGWVYAVDVEGNFPTGLPGVNFELWQDGALVGGATAVSTTGGSLEEANYTIANVFGNPSPGYGEYQVRIPVSSNTDLYQAYLPLDGVETLQDGSAVVNGVRVGPADGDCPAGDNPLLSAGNSCGNNIGFKPALFDISGFVSVDPRNTLVGTLDEIVVAGIPNVTVQLLEASSGVCSSTVVQTLTTVEGYAVTPDSGDPYAENFLFSDVPGGEYCISLAPATEDPDDFNESLFELYSFKGADADPGSDGTQLVVTVGPDSNGNDFPWEAQPDDYTRAYLTDPGYTIFSLGATEWLNNFKSACRTGDDDIQYKDRFKQIQSVSATYLITQLNTFLYLTVPPVPDGEPVAFGNACDVADALSQPLAEGRNNVDDLTKLYWQLLAAELNFHTPFLGLVLNPAGEEDGAIPENMLRYMERFLEQELFGPTALGKASSTYASEDRMLSTYNGGGGGGGGTGFE